MKGRLADADHRAARGRARRFEAGVVETGDDEGVEAGGVALGHFLDQSRRGEDFVEITLDRDRAAAPD